MYNINIKGGDILKKFNISMPVKFYQKLKNMAECKGMNVSQYIRFCVSEYWEMKGLI